jgi:hypothetical protein
MIIFRVIEVNRPFRIISFDAKPYKAIHFLPGQMAKSSFPTLTL